METDLETKTTEDVAEDLETQETEDTSKTDETKPDDWDKERQKEDFDRANSRYRRAEAELATMTEANERANVKLAELEEQVKALTDKKTDEQHRLDEMDPEFVDEKVANNIKRLEQRIRDKENQLAEIGDKISRYEQQQAEAEAKRKSEEAREEVLSTVEYSFEEHGISGAAKYRSEAIKLADELVDSGEVKRPTSLTAAVKLMTRCYIQVKNKKEKKTKTVPVDTGKGGAVQAGAKKTGIKKGSLDDVAAQMLEDTSWLE
ncbi:MAG TPA: hypothetical protein HPP87_07280 [Planctomycetes bacterium]|nr:hypothetical protein [Planctomycetota bacterium]